MPLRTPDQPTRFVDRYRERLNEEMKDQDLSDRGLADKLRDEANYEMPFSSINKTRNGTRQPAMDECYATAWVLGYPTLDSFLDGPAYVKVTRAAQAVGTAVLTYGTETRTRVQRAVYDLGAALRDPVAVAAMDEAHPGWREEYRDGITSDLDWIVRDLGALYAETYKRVTEVFDGLTETETGGQH